MLEYVRICVNFVLENYINNIYRIMDNCDLGLLGGYGNACMVFMLGSW